MNIEGTIPLRHCCMILKTDRVTFFLIFEFFLICKISKNFGYRFNRSCKDLINRFLWYPLCYEGLFLTSKDIITSQIFPCFFFDGLSDFVVAYSLGSSYLHFLALYLLVCLFKALINVLLA